MTAVTGLIGFIGLIGLANKSHAAGLIKPPNNLGLISYFSFEDATGTVIHDFSGKGIPGSFYYGSAPSAPKWISNGKSGRALRLTGGDNFKASSTLANFTSGNFTQRFYVRFSSSTLDSFVTGTGLYSNYGWYTDLTYGELYFLNNSSGSWAGTSVIPPITADRWYDMAFVRTGSSSYIYIDGAQAASGSTQTATISPNDYFVINYNAPANVSMDIDEYRLYNRALGATEIANLYSNPGAAVQRAASNTGLVGYWNFNEATGTIAHDTSGKGNSGTLTNGPTWTGGKFGKGINLDGNNDEIVVGDVNAVDNISQFSVSAWIKTGATPSGYFTAKEATFWFGANASGTVGWWVQGQFADNAIESTAKVNDGKWHMVTGTKDAVTGKIIVYVDGVYSGIGDISGNSPDNANSLVFGNRSPGGFNNFAGQIDDVRIYNRQLSAAEILKLYQATEITVNSSQNLRGPQSGLIGLWSFDGRDMYGTTAYDRSGNGNNGTLVNGARPVSGKIGQGIQLDGVDDYIQTGYEFLTTGSTNSVALWIKPNTCTSGNQDLFSANASRSALTISGIGQIKMKYYDGVDYIETNPATCTTAWQYIVAIWSPTRMELYQNGVLIHGINGTTNEFLPGYTDTFGIYSFSPTINAFNGLIDDARIYNRVLSLTEIQQLYDLGR